MTRKTASAALDAWTGSASRSARCCCNVFAGGTAAPALIPTRRKARSAAPAPNDLIEMHHLLRRLHRTLSPAPPPAAAAAGEAGWRRLKLQAPEAVIHANLKSLNGLI